VDVALSVKSDHLAPEDLARLARDVCTTLNRETAVQASLEERPAEAGARTGLEPTGAILLSLIQETGVALLAAVIVDVAKVYAERYASLVWDFRRSDGEALSIRGEDLRPERVQQTIARAGRFFTWAQ